MKSVPSYIHSFQEISDDELHQQTLRAAEGEKQATLLLLEHLAEVDQRRLHLKRGFSSLWEYTHKALGYSESQASERVNSMRLMMRVPEVKQELKSGQINLTVISKLASHVKREKLEPQSVINLLETVKSKPTRQVEKILAQESTETARPDRVRVITSTTTRITIDVDDEFMELLERVKELKGNHAATPKELLHSAMREFVKKRELKTEPSLRAQKVATTTVKPTPKLIAQPTQVPSNTRYIPISVKTAIRIRSGDRCEYADSKTERRCTSKTGLQFDHYPLAFALSGSNTQENLRQVCPGHNQLAAVQVFGRAKIEQYQKR